MKKGWAYLLVLVMMLSIPSGIASTEAAKPTVLTLGFTSSAPMEIWAMSNELKQLREEYNIEFEWTLYDDEKFSLILASNELPDIVMPRQYHMAAIIDNGMALNLDPLLAEYAPNLTSEVYSAAQELSRMMIGGPNHELYFLPVGLGMESAIVSETASRGYTVRWDLYKELGCPPIESDDDYLEVIRQMVEICPPAQNGQPVYGIGLYDNFTQWFVRGPWIMDSASLCMWTFSGSQYMATIEDTTLINGYTTTNRSAYWTDMRFYNKLYNTGLLDPDSFIMTLDEYNAKMAAGQYVAANNAGNASLYTQRLKDDPNTLAGLVVVPSANAVVGARKLQVTGGMPTDSIFISKNSPNWEAALTALNFFADSDTVRMTYNGIEGVDWAYNEEGVPYITEKGLNDRTAYTTGFEDYVANTGIYGQIYNFTMFQGTAIAPDGYVYNLAQMPDFRVLTLDPLRKDIAATFGVSRPSEALMNLVYEGKTIDNRNDYAQLVAMGITDIPLDITRIMTNCNDILYNAIPDLVMAASPEAFEAEQQKVLDALLAADEPIAWAWCEEAFNASKAIMQPLFEQALELYDKTAK